MLRGLAPTRAGPSRLIAVRPSAVALGKRPVIPLRAALPNVAVTGAGASSSRSFSWSPFGSGSVSGSSSAVPKVDTSATTAVPQHEPILSSSHPDLPNTASASSSPGQSMSATAGSPTASAASSHDTLPVDSASSSSISSAVESLPSAAVTDPSILPQTPALDTIPALEHLLTKSGMSLSEVLHSPEAVHAAMKVSDLSLLELGHGPLNLAGWVRDALVGMHNLTDLPWWGTIAATAIAFRLCLLPLIVRLTSHNVRLAAVQPQMTALFKRLNEAKASGDTQAQQVVLSTLQKLMKENDVSPFRPLLMPLLQMPFFLSFFYSLRKLAALPLPQLKEGGFGWVTDLTIPDPYYVLPITSMVLTNLVLRVGADGTAAMNSNSNMGHFRNAITVMSVVAIPFVGKMPAAVLFYWTFSNLYSLLQASILKQPRIKSLLGIPPPAPQAPLPPGTLPPKQPTYAETWTALREALSKRGQAYQQANARYQANIDAKERAQGIVREKNPVMLERVRERVPTSGPAPPPGPAVQAAATVLEGGRTSASAASGRAVPSQPASKSWYEAPGSGRDSKEDAKARRVAAAREKRLRA